MHYCSLLANNHNNICGVPCARDCGMPCACERDTHDCTYNQITSWSFCSTIRLQYQTKPVLLAEIRTILQHDGNILVVFQLWYQNNTTVIAMSCSFDQYNNLKVVSWTRSKFQPNSQALPHDNSFNCKWQKAEWVAWERGYQISGWYKI